jgi:glutaredoxin
MPMNVEIYGQAGCGWCSRAKRHLEAFQIPHVYRDLAEPGRLEELKRRFPDVQTVPQVFIGDLHIGGHDELVTIPLSHLQQMIGGQ